MKAPLVSVVVPTWNRAGKIRRTIDSVLAQTWRRLELIVVDDGSTDGTEAVVRGVADPRVRYLPKGPPRGAGASRNAGVRAARGELVAFNDAGDEWRPGKLEAQVPVLAALPDAAAMVYSSLIRVLPGGLEQRIDSPVFEAGDADTPRRALAMEVSGLYPQTAVIRREAFLSLGGFDESLRAWEDMEFFLRLARTRRFQFVPGHFTLLHDDARGVSTNMDAVYEAHRAVLAKHAAAFDADPAARVPHLRAAGRKLIPTHGAYARRALWTVLRSGAAGPADAAWMAVACGGRPLYVALSAARKGWWSLSGRAPALDANAGVKG